MGGPGKAGLTQLRGGSHSWGANPELTGLSEYVDLHHHPAHPSSEHVGPVRARLGGPIPVGH